LTGEYGLRDVFVGMPVKLGAYGVEGIMELELTDEEGKALLRGAEKIKAQLALLGETC